MNKILKNIILICCLGSALHISAQQAATIVNGVVRDEFDKPLPGVLISSFNGNIIGTTDSDGSYSVTVDLIKPVLSFSLLGYKDIAIEGDKLSNIVMHEDAHNNNEIIYLGHSTASRETFPGSISTVKGKTLDRSTYSRLQGTLTGNLSGLTSLETESQPGSENINMYIRGYSNMHATTAGVVIDGIYYNNYSHDLLYRISPMDIESVTILKDGASQALYGIEGSKGILVITTKRGYEGKPNIDIMVDEIIQQPTNTPMFINSATYASLRNLAAENDGLGKNYYFTNEQINKFNEGTDEKYPNTNWHKMLRRNLSQMQRAGVSVTGGSDKVKYYTNVNFTHQGSFWKTDQNNYSSDNNLYKVNIRANVDVELNKYLSGYLNMAGNIVRRHDPYSNTQSGSNNIYNNLFSAPPTLYGPLTPAIYDEAGNLVSGGQVTVTENMDHSPYGMLNRSGYYNQANTNIYSQFGLNLDMSFITPGLSASGKVGYLSYITATMGTTQSYERYRRSDDWESIEFIRQGTIDNTELAYSKSTAVYSYMSYLGGLDYKRSFGKHNVQGNAFAIYQGFTKNEASYDYNRVTTGIEGQYNYDNRYSLKIDLGYSGSDQFARGHRYIWTPGVSVAWIGSNESFIKENVKWLTLLKPRFTYAITGNDDLGIGRYAYNDKVSFGGGGSIGYLQYMTTESSFGNPNLEAEKIKKTNIGLDLGFLNQITLSVDFFKDKTNNGVSRSTIVVPSYQGKPLGTFPSMNMARYENKGYEIELNYRKRFNKDWSFNLGGFLDYNKNKVIYKGETPQAEDYAYKYREEGYPLGQIFGYKVDYSNGNGMFNFQSEVDKSNLKYDFGTPRVGDLIYQDLNDDGVINDKDKAPLGEGALPRYTYGISGGASYKNFEFNFLIQGVGKYTSIMSGSGVYETSYEGVFGQQHLKSWTQERWNNNEEILYPALSTKTSTNHQSSDFFLYNRSYIRLKNVELSYNLPNNIIKMIHSKSLRVILSGENLITIGNMKNDDFGPEGSYMSFPVFRMYSIGLRAQF